MRKKNRLRKAIIIFLLVIVTLAALIILIVPPVIKSKAKKEIINSIESVLYTKASIEDISINWRKGSFTLVNLELNGVNEFENVKILNIPKIEIKLAEKSGTKLSNITLDEFIIEDTEIFVLINYDGESCWQAKAKNQSIEIDKNRNDFPNITINNFTIQNLNIYYTNQANGQNLQMLNNSINVIKEENLNYKYIFNTNGISLSARHHAKHTPRLIAEGMIVLTDDKYTISGHNYFNQLYTEFNAVYNKLNPELSVYELVLPECSTREVLSILRPIDSVGNNKLESVGTWKGNLKIEGHINSSSLNNIHAELIIDNAIVRNKASGDFASINTNLLFDYNSNKDISDNVLEAYSQININNDEIFGKLSINKIGDKSVIEGVSIGYLELEKLNDVLHSSVYEIGGTLNSIGSIKGTADTTNVNILSDIKVSLINAKFTNTETGTDLLINASANCINGKIDSETEFITSKGSKYSTNIELNKFWEYLFKNETVEINVKTEFPVLRIPLSESKNFSNLRSIEKTDSKGINLSEYFPDNISLSHEFISDTLYIGNSMFEDLYLNFKFNPTQIGMNKISMYKNNSKIDMSLFIDHLTDTITKLVFTQNANDLIFDTTISSIVKGKIDIKADIQFDLNNQGKPIIESINGYYLITPKDFYLQQEQLSKKSPTKFKFNDKDYIPIATDSILMKVTNGDLELLPFYIVSTKSGLRGKGYIYQLDSLDLNFNARIAENYQSKSVILAVKGLALMQKSEFIDDKSPIELGINVTGSINKPKYNIYLIE
jgi:hypothetical protein